MIVIVHGKKRYAINPDNVCTVRQRTGEVSVEFIGGYTLSFACVEENTEAEFDRITRVLANVSPQCELETRNVTPPAPYEPNSEIVTAAQYIVDTMPSNMTQQDITAVLQRARKMLEK